MMMMMTAAPTSPLAPPPPPPLRIEPGCAYALRDLQSAPAWNGSKVVVLEYLQDKDRYVVRPVSGPDASSTTSPPLPPTLAVRAANLGSIRDAPSLAPVSSNDSVGNCSSSRCDDPYLPSTFAPGSLCALHGLNAAVFNGQKVVVVQYLDDQNRYQVRPIPSGDASAAGGGPLPAIMAVKPMNLRLLQEAPPTGATPFVGAPAAATNTVPAPGNTNGGAPAPPPPQRALTKQRSKRKVFSLFRKKSKDAAYPAESAEDTDTVTTPTPSPPSSPGPALTPQQPQQQYGVPHQEGGLSAVPGAVPSPYPFRPPAEQPPLTFGGGISHSSNANYGGSGNSSGQGAGSTTGLSSHDHVFLMMSQSAPNLKLDTILEADDTRHSRDGDESNPPQPPQGHPSQFGGQNQQQPQQAQQPQSQPIRPGLPPRMGGLTRTGSVPCFSTTPDASLSSSPSRGGEPRPARRTSLSSMSSSAHSRGSGVEPRLKSGSVAKLTGLTHQSFLNDLVVAVLDYSEQHGRYRVKVRDGEPAASAVNGKDLMIHRRNLLPLAVTSNNNNSSSFDETSKEDSTASKSVAVPPATTSALPSHAPRIPYKVGDRLSVTGMALRSPLNGAQVEVLDYDAFTKLYQVRPVQGSSGKDESRGEVLNVRHENLTPPRLADGTRVVLTHVPGKPLLDGELGTIAYYQKEKGAYRVRLLGATAVDRNNGMELLDVPLISAREAPPSAMWVNMALHGENLRVPLSCHVENGALYAKLDVFAGVDRVVPTATLLYGDDKCDWLNDEEVIAFVKEKTPFTLKCCMSSSGTADAMFQSNCPFLEPMVEYELLQATAKVNFFKLLFPIEADDEDDASSKIAETATVTNSYSDEPEEGDDIRSFEGDDDDEEDDENPFLAPSPPPRKRAESPAEKSSTMEPPASQEPQEETLESSITLADVFKPVEYELVDDEDEPEAAPTPPVPVPTPSHPASRPTRRPDPEEVMNVSIPRETTPTKPTEDPPRVHRIPTDASVATPRRPRSELSQSWHSARSREASPSQRKPDPPGRQSHEAPVEYYKHLIQQRGRELESTRVGRESDRRQDCTDERPRARSSSRATKKKKKSRSSSKVRSRSRSVTRSDFSLLSIPLLPIGSR